MAQRLQDVSVDIAPSHYVLNATAPDATARGISMRVTNALMQAAAAARGLPASPQVRAAHGRRTGVACQLLEYGKFQ
jgi:hypothetical protein